ncbi:HlyD family efflux transporter periplasmic adaptor subunit [Flavobacterium sp.]|uniref:HlyD family secretion protein n=1 Tax=Flavobacterium sp. TaxID=239 RepID=UPI00286DB27F|nr:HlyD family efflux transporter periplasmic adaptor subunit [Flavobacterium sp.]
MNFSSDPVNNIENLIAKNRNNSISIYFTVVLIILTLLFLLPIIKLDISSQSRGIIRSKTDNVPVTTIVSGRITWLSLKNNAFVEKGDTIIKISKEGLATQKSTQDTLQSSVKQLLIDVANLINGNRDLKTSTAIEDLHKYQSRKNELQSKVAQAQANYNRNRILFEKDVIAKAEFEKFVYELQFAKEAIQSYVSQQKSIWENQKRELQTQLKNGNGTISKIKVEEHNYLVLAPISGTIENFTGLQVGSFINASQPIADISSIDNLIVETTVSPNDIGLIKKNKPVKFQIDAFNYNQWGLLEGKVIEMDNNITLQENQAFFKVRCSLNSKTMQLSSGYKTQVSKGMTLTTRYIITRRSLFDLLFDKVDDWLNPKTIITRA